MSNYCYTLIINEKVTKTRRKPDDIFLKVRYFINYF